MARTNFTSVDDYLAAQPPAVRATLESVRTILRKALPKAAEGISYQIPVYRINGERVIFFAGWKQHFSLYPAGDRLLEAIPAVAGYKISKGTVRFPYSGGVPAKLISAIAKFRAREALKDALSK